MRLKVLQEYEDNPFAADSDDKNNVQTTNQNQEGQNDKPYQKKMATLFACRQMTNLRAVEHFAAVLTAELRDCEIGFVQEKK